MGEIRALLVTDVVDSTGISEAIGDARAAALWAAHDRLARDLLPRWRGREIDKTDGMLLLFGAADDAARYALDYHAALATLDPPLRARAGLHLGPVILRENTSADVALGAKPLEVEGVAKSIAARVAMLASGGQTLVSSDAARALPASGIQAQSHGHWRLKGIAEPMEIFEIARGDMPCTPPGDAPKAYRVVRTGEQWLPARSIKHSLPASQDAFVGRAEAFAELASRFDEGARLVSVLGIGGSGKTRLATQYAWTWLGDFPGGAWFCDLTQARRLDGILHAVAQGLDVPLGTEDPVMQLAHAIAGHGECLVILDNFEQVGAHAAETLGRWLARAPLARFLVTTREVLGLRGEQVLSLAPLAAAEAAALFARRAREAKPDFRPGPADDEVVLRLVELLDRLPLAIELAAARVRVMPPRTVLARMSDRFTLLASSTKRDDRQSTLRAVLDWSWDLLPMPEQAALAQMSVFDGGFTLESLEAVLDLSTFEDAPLAMDALQSLTQKSLVRPAGEERFDLLVSVKEYAAQHLRTEGRYAGSGPQAEVSAHIRHGSHFAGLDAAVADLAMEIDNLIAACRRAAARGDEYVAVRALEGAWATIRLRGPFRAAIELARLVGAIPGAAPATRARMHGVAGRAFVASGKDSEAEAEFQASLQCARDAADPISECRAHIGLAAIDSRAGRMDPARDRFEQALELALAIGDRGLRSEAHNGFGTMHVYRGQEGEARTHYDTALSLARAARDRETEGRLLSNLGILDINAGRMDEARAHIEAALVLARARGDRRLEGNALNNLGQVGQLQGRLDEALDALVEALSVQRDLGDRQGETIALCNLGLVYEGLARAREAREHFEAALAVARELADRRTEGQTLGYLGALHARQGDFEEARRCLLLGRTHLDSISDPMSLGILLCALAEAEHLAGMEAAAHAALAEAESIRATLGASPESELGRSITRVRALGRVATA